MYALLSGVILALCIQVTPKRVLLQNSEDPDEMRHNGAFHQGLHCLFVLFDLILYVPSTIFQ